MKLALVGDIGGTNARFALWKNQQLESIQVLATADHASPIDAISLYLSGLGLAPGSIGSVCLSVAGPVSGDEFKFTNNHWRLGRKEFCEILQVDQLLLVNDFSAMALGMTRLQPGEFRVVCEGTPEPLRPAVVIGPGTGLGVGTLLDLGQGRFAALPGEGGHVDLPLSSLRETQLWQHIFPGARFEGIEPLGQHFPVAGHPLQGGVGDHHIGVSGRQPVCDVGQLVGKIGCRGCVVL